MNFKGQFQESDAPLVHLVQLRILDCVVPVFFLYQWENQINISDPQSLHYNSNLKT